MLFQMLASLLVYLALTTLFVGIVLCFRRRTRKRGVVLGALSLAIAVIGLVLPAPERSVDHPNRHLDELMPRWQFSEHHTAHVAAPPDRVFEAICAVRADEIALFRLLTWIRRGGRDLPENILNAGTDRPILDVATTSGFIYLADDPPRELVVGTVVVAPRQRTPRVLTPDVFRRQLAPGYALAAMNFYVSPDGRGGSVISTETRVYANDASSRRKFARYWRIIYPGSSLIRFMWLRAIERRAAAG